MSGEQTSAQLEEQLATALCALTGVPRSEVDQESLDELMGALLPVVRAYGDQRAAEELRAMADDRAETLVITDGEPVLVLPTDLLRARAAALAAGRPDEEGDEG